eukprot:TRINITY_DN8914_c0_g1_i1.p1 TRINITY_DN8914_c0_g1~~TRINITY_DN8914_c0_g1_i1.p1  ORF type:complete len:302 (-),score=57.66 TRINITY_DN8914_c0_g1_i1:296-1201(-)
MIKAKSAKELLASGELTNSKRDENANLINVGDVNKETPVPETGEAVKSEDVQVDFTGKEARSHENLLEKAAVKKQSESPGDGEKEPKVKLREFLQLMFLREKAKPSQKIRRSKSAVKDVLHKQGRVLAKGALFFLMVNHQLGSIFVSDTVFNTKKERLKIYIATLMSQFFTSTNFYNTDFDKKNANANVKEDKCESADCILFESLTGMKLIDLVFIVINNLLTLPLVLGCALFFVRKFVQRDKLDKVNVGQFKRNLRNIQIRVYIGYVILYLYCAFCIWMVVQFSANQDDMADHLRVFRAL